MGDTTHISWADLPAVALSIMQPWAWLIVNRGSVLIHAGKNMDGDADHDLRCGKHPVTGGDFYLPTMPWLEQRGGIVGVAEITDCVSTSPSPWFVGRYGFVLRNAQPLPFMACKGALGFFRPTLPGARP